MDIWKPHDIFCKEKEDIAATHTLYLDQLVDRIVVKASDTVNWTVADQAFS